VSDEAAGWRVEFARAAQRDLRRLDPPIRRRVLTAIEGLLADPPQGDVKRLTGTGGEYRLRVADWRVRFARDPNEQLILIERVLPRGRAYRD
jgi:mRNA interferase RelE/StbE